MELMLDVPACSTAASGQPSEAGEAWVRRHEPVDLKVLAYSPISEILGGL